MFGTYTEKHPISYTEVFIEMQKMITNSLSHRFTPIAFVEYHRPCIHIPHQKQPQRHSIIDRRCPGAIRATVRWQQPYLDALIGHEARPVADARHAVAGLREHQLPALSDQPLGHVSRLTVRGRRRRHPRQLTANVKVTHR